MNKHSAASEAFDPQGYELQGYELRTVVILEDLNDSSATTTVEALKAQGYVFAAHQKPSNCGHCGQRLKYAALLSNATLMEMIYVGETCLTGRFLSGLTKQQFKARRAEARAARDRAKLPERIESAVMAHPALAELTYPDMIADSSPFVKDIAAQFTTHGRLSERQISSVISALDKEIVQRGKAEARELLQAQERQQQDRALADGEIMFAPSGENVVSGRVERVWVATVEYGYAPPQEVLRMWVADECGYKVVSTVPKSLVKKAEEETASERHSDIINWMTGRMVSYVANLRVFEDFKAAGSRPRRATFCE